MPDTDRSYWEKLKEAAHRVVTGQVGEWADPHTQAGIQGTAGLLSTGHPASFVANMYGEPLLTRAIEYLAGAKRPKLEIPKEDPYTSTIVVGDDPKARYQAYLEEELAKAKADSGRR